MVGWKEMAVTHTWTHLKAGILSPTQSRTHMSAHAYTELNACMHTRPQAHPRAGMRVRPLFSSPQYRSMHTLTRACMHTLTRACMHRGSHRACSLGEQVTDDDEMRGEGWQTERGEEEKRGGWGGGGGRREGGRTGRAGSTVMTVQVRKRRRCNPRDGLPILALATSSP